jgi:hypothetical protein
MHTTPHRHPLKVPLVYLGNICLFIQLLSGFSMPAFAQEFPDFQESWGSTSSFQQLEEDFKGFEFPHPNAPAVRIMKRSLAEKDPQLYTRVSEIDRLIVGAADFASRFKTWKKDEEPTGATLNAFYEYQAHKFNEGFRLLYLGIRAQNPGLATEMAVSNFKRQEDIKKILAEFKAVALAPLKLEYQSTVEQSKAEKERFQELNLISTRLQQLYRGMIAKYYAVICLSDVLHANIPVARIPGYEEKILSRLSEMEKEIAQQPGKLDEYIRQFPEILNAPWVMRFEPKSVEERFNLIHQWFEKKEIDVATMDGWYNVRAYIHEVNKDVLMRSYGEGSQSMYDHCKELARIRDFDQWREFISRRTACGGQHEDRLVYDSGFTQSGGSRSGHLEGQPTGRVSSLAESGLCIILSYRPTVGMG